MLTKIVNGKVVELTEEEEILEKARWADADEKRANYLKNEKWKDDRRATLPTAHDLIVALWEKLIENRPEAAEALQAERLAGKENIPKPSSN